MTEWSEAEAEAAPFPTGVRQVQIGEQTVLMEVTLLGGEEEEVAGGLMSFEGVSAAIEALSSNLGKAVEKARPTRVALEFACEVAAEAGHLTALFVKGSGKATIKVTLEWIKPTGTE